MKNEIEKMLKLAKINMRTKCNKQLTTASDNLSKTFKKESR